MRATGTETRYRACKSCYLQTLREVTLVMSLLCHQTSVAEYLTMPPLIEEVSRSEAKIVFKKKTILFCTEGNSLTECKAVRPKCLSDHLKLIFIPDMFHVSRRQTGTVSFHSGGQKGVCLLKYYLFCASLPFIVSSSCFNTDKFSFNLDHKRKLFSRCSRK